MYMGFSLHHDSQLGTHRRGESIGTCCYDGVAAAVATLHVPMGVLFGTYIHNYMTRYTRAHNQETTTTGQMRPIWFQNIQLKIE